MSELTLQQKSRVKICQELCKNPQATLVCSIMCATVLEPLRLEYISDDCPYLLEHTVLWNEDK